VPNAIYREPRDAGWSEAWRITERLLEAIHRECGDRGVPFLMVTLTNAVQVDPDATLCSRLERSLDVTDLFYAERRVQSIGERCGFPVLALAPEFQERARREKLSLHGFGERWGDTGTPSGTDGPGSGSRNG
jgi:hypothetical protein